MTYKDALAYPVGKVLRTKTGDGIAAIQRHTIKCRMLADAERGFRVIAKPGILAVIVTK